MAQNREYSHKVIEKWTDAAQASGSDNFQQGTKFTFIQFERFLNLSDTVALSLEGKHCLDFGCGGRRPFSIAAMLYLFGADQISCIDVCDVKNTPEVARGLFCLLAVMALGMSGFESKRLYRPKYIRKRIADFNLDALKAGNLRKGLPRGIKHYIGDYLDLHKQIGQLDLMVSSSVFEHIPNLEKVLKIYKMNMNPNGFIYTDIDYRDHRLYTLKLSPWQYLLDGLDVTPGYINKIRHTDMIKLINDAGFSVVSIDQVLAEPPKEVLAKAKHISNKDLCTLQDTLMLA